MNRRRLFLSFLIVVLLAIPLQNLLPLNKARATGSLPAYGGIYTTNSTSNDFKILAANTDANGNLYDGGYFCSDTDFNPGQGTDILSSPNNECDAYVTKYNASGTYHRTYAFLGNGTSYSQTNRMAADTNGNLYTVGYYSGTVDFNPFSGTDNHTSSNTGNDTNMFLVKLTKTDSYGYAYTWTNSAGGNSQAKFVTTDPSGNVFIVGSFSGTINFDPTGGTDNHSSSGSYANSFLTKINANGTYGFTYTWTQGGTDDINVITDSSGHIYVRSTLYASFDEDPTAGTDTHTVAAASAGTWVAKINPDGTYAWGYSIDGGYVYSGSMNTIATDTLGNLYYTGTFQNPTNFDPTGGTDSHSGGGPFLTKINANGTYGYTYTFSPSNSSDYGMSVATDASNNVFLQSQFSGSMNFDPTGGTDTQSAYPGYIAMGITKINADGTYAATGIVAGQNSTYWEVDPSSLVIDPSNNVYVAGYYIGAVDFDPSASTDLHTSASNYSGFITKLGTALYTNPTYAGTYTATNASGDTHAYSVQTDANNNVYYAGDFSGTVDFNPTPNTEAYTSPGNETDGYVSKVNADGTYAKTYPFLGDGSSFATVNRTATDASGNLYIAGYYYGTVDLDPTSGTHLVTSTGSHYNLFYVKINADGTYNTSFTLPTDATGNSNGKYIAVDSNGNAFLAGTYGGTVNFNPYGGTDNHTATDTWNNTFLTKLNADGTYGWTETWTQGGQDALNLVIDPTNHIYIKGDYYANFDADPTAGTDTRTTTGVGTYLIKLNNDGTYVYGDSIDGAYIYSGSMNSLALDTAGNMYLTGNFNGTYDFDPTGGTDTHSGSGAYITRLNANNTYGWTYTYNPVGNTDYGESVATDSSNNVYLAQNFSNVQNMDPTGGVDTRTTILSNISTYSIGTTLSRFNADGTYAWTQEMTGIDNTYTDVEPQSLAVDGNDNIYMAGHFMGTIDFNPYSPNDNQSSPGSRGLYLTKFGSPALSFAASVSTPTPTATPTPSPTPTPTPSTPPTVTPSTSPTPSPTINPTPTPSTGGHPGPGITPTPIPAGKPIGVPSIAPTPTPPDQPQDILEISSVRVEPSTTTATLTWITNRPATDKVDYGLTTIPDHSQTSSIAASQHNMTIQDLSPATTYHFTITSSDSSGNATYNGTFLTLSIPAASTSQPPPSISPLQQIVNFAAGAIDGTAASIVRLNNIVLSAATTTSNLLPSPAHQILIASLTSAQQNPLTVRTSQIAQVSMGLLLLLIIIPATLTNALSSPWENFTNIPTRVSSGLMSLLEFLRIRKKRSTWGVIYDSATKQPIESALVTLYRRTGEQEQKIETRLTGLEGKFGFLVQPGVYRVEARKTHYTFPSQKLSGAQEDTGRDHLYYGGPISFRNPDVVSLNIPLDPIAYDWNEAQKKRFYHPVSVLWREHVAGTTALLLSFLAILIYVLSPTPLNLALLLLNLLLGIIRFGSHKRDWSVLTNQMGQLLPDQTIRTIKWVNSQEIPQGFLKTDRLGRFFLILSAGTSYLQVEQPLPSGQTRIIKRFGPFTSKGESVFRKNLKI